MTLFEYLSVATSIVLALGVSKLISSVRHVFTPGRRDWIHISFFLLLLLVHLLQWWRLWPLHDVVSWNFFQFLIVMGSPISLYFAAAVLVSDEPSEVSSWRDHLAEAHRWFFAALVVGVLFGVLRFAFLLNDPQPPLLVAVVLVPILAGAIFQNRRVHAAVAALGWTNVVFLISESFTAVS